MNKYITKFQRYGHRIWANHSEILLKASIILMIMAALLRIKNEFWRLLFDSGKHGAIDLKIFHAAVQLWFSGEKVYGELYSAVYPPASYLILWPLLGWLEVTPARILWAITTVPALVWLIYLLVKESRASTVLEKTFIAFLPVSMYATSATIGNGQLNVHFLPMLLASLLIYQHKDVQWSWNLLAACWFVLALVKPNVFAPFFWIILFASNRVRPLMVVSGYIGLTFLASMFQEGEMVTLMQSWLERGIDGAQSGAKQGGTKGVYANVHTLLYDFGIEGLNAYISLFILFLLGLWVFRYRRADLWLQLGVVAIVARFWTYHRLYDDILILLPMLSFFRIVKQSQADGNRFTAGLLLFTAWFAALAPASMLSSESWNFLFSTFQVFVWTLSLAFLMYYTWNEQREQSLLSKQTL